MEDGIIVSTMTKVREKRFISRLKDRDNERRLLTADGRNQMLVILVRYALTTTSPHAWVFGPAPALLVRGAVSNGF